MIVILYAEEKKMTKNKKLTEFEKKVVFEKATERPFSGEYNSFYEEGTYKCKVCSAPLYKSNSKFNSHSGWPSFDDAIEGAVKEIPDKDGLRVEIVCAKCGAHLGHIFKGEKFTEKNTRHCVNSASLDFVSKEKAIETPKEAVAYFAGGCFWGVEYHFEKLKGVISATSGYMGGDVEEPTYKQVCYEKTGHLEVVEIKYNPNLVSYETLAKLFFEIHDPTQANGQGPDIGEQYKSAIFYNTSEEKETLEKLIKILKDKKYNVVTKLIKADTPFWKAEEYHQDYYEKHNKKPYCHAYQKRF
jgi:peptide methionine sulfoxide reductase msrA/msrB